jgi:hypothetical protein
MIAELRNQHVSQQTGSGKTAFDRTRWRGRFHHAVATVAGELGPYVANHLEAVGDVLQLLGDIFAELAQLAAAIGTAVAGDTVRHHLTRQVFGQRLTPGSRLRFRSRCDLINRGFHLGLRGLQLFQVEFELLQLNHDLLALDAEHPALQLLDDQLQVFDLLAAGAQLLILLGERLAMGLKLSLKRSQLVFMRSKLLLMRNEQCQQRLSIQRFKIRQRSGIHGRSMPSKQSECTRKCAGKQRNLAGQLDCDLRRPGPLRPAPINAFEQHRKLRTRQTHSSFRSLRPDESSSLQTLGKEAQAVAIEPEKLDHVASAPAKDKDVAGERLLLQHRLHLRTQAVETTP